MPVIGFLSSRSANPSAEMVAAFRESLSRAGYIEGRNVAIEFRWADGRYDRLPALASDLVRRRVAVIVATGGEPSPQVAMATTQTIPIVFTAQGDPVKQGLVPSLNRPGGNATGVTFFGTPLVAKRLEVLHQLVPKASLIAMLINPSNPLAEPEAREAQDAGLRLGLQLFVVRVSTERDFERAFESMIERRPERSVSAQIRSLIRTRGSCCVGCSPRIASHIFLARIRQTWRLDELWQRPRGGISASWCIHRSCSSGRKAWRFANHPSHEVSGRPKSQDSEGAWT